VCLEQQRFAFGAQDPQALAGMLGACNRDEVAALIEQRAQLLDRRRADAATRIARLCWGTVSIAYAIAIARALTRAPGVDAPEALARGFGGLFFGALMGQPTTAWMQESAGSVALGYAWLALGASSGVFGWRAFFALAARVRERETRHERAVGG